MITSRTYSRRKGQSPMASRFYGWLVPDRMAREPGTGSAH